MAKINKFRTGHCNYDLPVELHARCVIIVRSPSGVGVCSCTDCGHDPVLTAEYLQEAADWAVLRKAASGDQEIAQGAKKVASSRSDGLPTYLGGKGSPTGLKGATGRTKIDEGQSSTIDVTADLLRDLA